VNQPNILYIHSHDTGRYVQPYGFAVPTPRIQKLAEEGVLFRQAFNAAPTCSPSRAALLTGQVPHSCGQFGLVNRGFELRDRYKHLAQTLRKAGYATLGTGVHHVVSDPLTCGYGRWLPTADHGSASIAAAAAAFLDGAPEGPFFFAVGFSDTHRRFPAPGPEDDPRYCCPPLPLPDTPETRRDMAAFRTSARRFDAAVGTILDALERNGLAENTLVICTTDHGIAFPYMKCNLTHHGTGVMLIVRGPGGFTGGQVSDAMVSQMDLYPTLCELLGIEPPEWLQGTSLLPLLRGEKQEVNEQIYAEVNYHCPYEPMRSLRTPRYNYVRHFADYPHPMLANVDDSPSKSVLVAHGMGEREVAVEELYDLVYDPNEVCNLAGDPAHARVLADMRRRLEVWMQRSEDPLLDGRIPLPEGAVENRPEDLSPGDLWNYTPQPKGLV
jgi:N-sulfoglucosamine sulfohydrolase